MARFGTEISYLDLRYDEATVSLKWRKRIKGITFLGKFSKWKMEYSGVTAKTEIGYFRVTVENCIFSAKRFEIELSDKNYFIIWTISW